MKYINRNKIPASLASALELIDQDYIPNADFSASGLIAPVRISCLQQRHHDDIVVDVSETIWKALGVSFHSIIERGQIENSLSEERIYGSIKIGDDTYTISGKFDLYEPRMGGVITDYKVTTKWKWIVGLKLYREETLETWTIQANIYAWLLRKFYGFQVSHLYVLMFFRDWMLSESLRQIDYPNPVEMVTLNLWSLEAAEAFIRDRVSSILEARKLSDDDLPRCSDKEIWRKNSVWKVKEEGRKKSFSGAANFKSKDEAQRWIDRNFPEENSSRRKIFIEEHPALAVRCENYCSVSEFCNQYNEVKK